MAIQVTLARDPISVSASGAQGALNPAHRSFKVGGSSVNVFSGNPARVTVSVDQPSGGRDGDIWFVVAA